MNTVKRLGIVSILLMFGLRHAYGQGALNLDVQNDNGNSRLVLFSSSNLVVSSFITGPSGIAGFGISPANSLWQGQTTSDITQSLAGFAIVTNLTTGQSVNIDSFMVKFSSGTGFLFGFSSFFFSMQAIPWNSSQLQQRKRFRFLSPTLLPELFRHNRVRFLILCSIRRSPRPLSRFLNPLWPRFSESERWLAVWREDREQDDPPAVLKACLDFAVRVLMPMNFLQMQIPRRFFRRSSVPE